MRHEQRLEMAFLAVRTDRATGERFAIAVLWLTREADTLRALYNKFSRYDVVTYMVEWHEALAILRGERPLPSPIASG